MTEITEADLIIHVVDISHSSFEDHIESVNVILSDIGVEEKPTIMLFNKTDMYCVKELTDKDIFESQQEIVSLKNLKTNLKNIFNNKVYFVSALSKKDINGFKKDLYKSVRKIHVTRFPYNAFLYPDIK